MDNQEKESNFLFYRGKEGEVKVRVILGDETIWVSQIGISEIFESSKQNISYHFSNIFKEGELDEKSVVKEILTTASDGKNYYTKFYNLEAIISIGYRISSSKATQFRKWATSILKGYLVKGFAMDDERLKQGSSSFGKDYFSELLERIREIRSSERRFYEKITDIYADCSIDYDAHSFITKEFYATVQNKLHWAIHHHTAAELIAERANSQMPNMGLTNWKNQQTEGKILKSDISVAKNYLNKEELDELNRVVSMYLDFAENMARRNKEMRMADWVERLDAFLNFNEYGVLTNAGKISANVAKKLAENHFIKFRVIQDKEYVSDFDKVVRQTKESGTIPTEKEMQKGLLAELQEALSSGNFKIKDDENSEDNLSDFNNKLKQGLNFNPKEDKK